MENCCLLISANESYQMAEKDWEKFTGIKISHSTLVRIQVSIRGIKEGVCTAESTIAFRAWSKNSMTERP